MLATLLLNVTGLVTAMGLARERETGTLEQVLVTPIRPSVLLAGKCLPYVLFGLVDILAILRGCARSRCSFRCVTTSR